MFRICLDVVNQHKWTIHVSACTAPYGILWYGMAHVSVTMRSLKAKSKKENGIEKPNKMIPVYIFSGHIEFAYNQHIYFRWLMIFHFHFQPN